MPRLVCLLCVSAFAAGCMGDDSPSIEPAELSQTVLQRSDLPAVFEQFDEGRLQMIDAPRGDRGWKARYRRSGSPETRGPIVIESRVDRFEDADAAGEAFAAARKEVLAGEGAAELEPPALGDDAVAVRLRQEAIRPVDFFTIAWREANVIASVTANGFAGTFSFEQAAALARKQARRIERAADS